MVTVTVGSQLTKTEPADRRRARFLRRVVEVGAPVFFAAQELQTQALAGMKRARTWFEEQPTQVLARSQSVPTRNLKRTIRRTILKSHEEKTLTQAAQASGTVSATGNVIYINPIVQGSGAGNREGRDVVLNSLEVGWSLAIPNGTAVNSDSIRMIVVWDKLTRGANPGVTDILNSATISAPYQANNYKTRFHIVFDKTIDFNPGFTSGATPLNTGMVKSGHFFKKIGRRTHYLDQTTGGVGDVDAGGLFLLLISANAYANLTVTDTLRFTEP